MTDKPADTKPFAERLLAWWDVHGRKDLPWQHPREPYRVWVSEIMLQQTQVSTVIPYFERFMQRFPDLPALAAAPQDDVLAHWSGLGYYARARNLHAAARQCVEQCNGTLPSSADELVTLPGIGRSTANAIISQSQDVPATVMDGNVKRVMARHAAIEGWAGKSAVLKALLHEADLRLPDTRGADYTQAIMDLGATLCTGSGPDCEQCPVSQDCQALREGRVGELPSPNPKTKVKAQTLFMMILRKPNGDVLLEQRPASGIWGGLWSLPESADAQKLKSRLAVGRATELPAFEHRLSHRVFSIHPLLARSLPEAVGVREGHIHENRPSRWVSRKELRQLGVPRPVMRILEELENSNA